MKRYAQLLTVALAAMLFASCGSSKQATNTSGTAAAQNTLGKIKHSELQGEWTIVSAAGMSNTDAEEKPTIWFDTKEHLTHGNASCNTFDGEYTTGGNQTLKFGNLALTMRLCGNMDFEDKLMKSFDNVASYGKLPNGNVGLFSAEGKMLIELAR